MSKHRVYDIAKELNTDNKTILDILRKNNIEVKSHSSTVDDAARQLVVKAVKGNSQPGAKPQPQVAAKQQVAAKVQQAVQPMNRQKQVQPQAQPQQKKQEQKSGQQPKAQAQQAKQQGQQPQKNGAQQKQGQAKHGGSQPDDRRQKHDGQKQAHQGGQNSGGRHDRNDRNDRNDGRNGGGKPGQRNGRNESQRGGQNSGNRNDKGDRNDKNDKRNNRDNRMERADRMERNDRNRQNGGGRNERNDRNGKNGRNSFNNNNNNNNNGRNNRGKNNRGGRNQQPAPKMEIARPKNIKVGETIIVKDLASKMSCTAAEIIKKLMLMGVLASINQEIDFDTAALVASEFGVNVEELPPEVDPTLIPEIVDDPKSLVLRPPVVTVMGHVDHGKTSLLDVIRKTSVTSHEAGGITQHIGAYQVKCQGKKIVFLDTPGHEAFTAMRARGAQVTDIAILVVAADDGVMPQTIEAIHHAKDADVPIIVAVNKIDKPGANPANVKNELMEHGLVPEEYGGDTIMVEVSAKKNIGINDLLEMVLLVAEMKELKANPKREARGVIIEAQLDKGRGPVATVLVQSGTLRIGDSIVAGTTYGKVRAMLNDRGENVKKAGPSVPVEVLGLNDVPAAGDELAALEEKQARTIAEKRMEKQRNEMIHAKKVSLDDLFNQIQEGQLKDLNIVVKADVQGSVEALNSSLLGLNKNDEVRVRIVHSGVGAVTESDVMLASASNALVIAFNVRPDANARRVADAEAIDIRTYRVIYDALNDVKDAMSGMLAPKYKEVIQGKVEIRQVMKFSKALVAGSYVLEGKITNQSKIRIVRDNIEVFDGELDGLRRFKDDVKEVAAGYECGITIKDYKDFREGDIIEAYIMEEVKTSINDVNKD
ncbi:translation initiation factor IF-2 [Veillonellaceae bacterium WCA-693-APC-5D-A]|uniref:Translation initiation factor IF-2 n=1 Tax=Anaerovibrio slackiae TaxID=2652309 RepID=A0A6I2UH31_9FIRM|nr:translation initiation factor IF-2 [Anaerovibrio slackiae]MSU08086.1 translation initiation factor IF-2 [Anaerovibrio slackiae]